jgi:hypothetical protein
MAADRKIFPPIAIAMVRAGEASGTLETTLARLGEHLKRSEAVRQQVRSALVYPAILVVTAFGSVMLILTVVLPMLRSLFEEAGPNLPLATRALLGLSDAIRRWCWALALGLLALAAAVHRALADPALSLALDRRLLRLPLLGDTIRQAEAARFAARWGRSSPAGWRCRTRWRWPSPACSSPRRRRRTRRTSGPSPPRAAPPAVSRRARRSGRRRPGTAAGAPPPSRGRRRARCPGTSPAPCRGASRRSDSGTPTPSRRPAAFRRSRAASAARRRAGRARRRRATTPVPSRS